MIWLLELNTWLHKELCKANSEALEEVNKLIEARNAPGWPEVSGPGW